MKRGGPAGRSKEIYDRYYGLLLPVRLLREGPFGQYPDGAHSGAGYDELYLQPWRLPTEPLSHSSFGNIASTCVAWTSMPQWSPEYSQLSKISPGVTVTVNDSGGNSKCGLQRHLWPDNRSQLTAKSNGGAIRSHARRSVLLCKQHADNDQQLFQFGAELPGVRDIGDVHRGCGKATCPSALYLLRWSRLRRE